MIKKVMKKKRKKGISAKRAVITSTVVDVLDIVINAIVALITGSVVMIAETVQGFGDVMADISILTGLKQSKKASDRKHPLGHGRSIYFWSFVAGLFLLIVTASATFYMGLRRFLDPQEIRHISLAFVVLAFFVISNGYSLSVSFRRILGKKRVRNFIKVFRESSFVETKMTFTSDLIGTFAAIIGLIALGVYQITGDLRFDGVGAMAIGLTLAAVVLFLLNNIRKFLLGRRASPEIEKKIKKAIVSVKDVKAVLDLKTVVVGLGKILVNAEISVNKKLTTKKIEKLIDEVKETARKDVPEVKYIQIEIETPERHVKIRAGK
ncbi:MAG: cation diffusion facilitator family transporter [Candidatus Pacearchaeota archaeon]